MHGMGRFSCADGRSYTGTFNKGEPGLGVLTQYSLPTASADVIPVDLDPATSVVYITVADKPGAAAHGLRGPQPEEL